MAPNENPWGGSSAATDKPKLTKRVSETFSRTKVVASVGFAKSKVAARKVKGGAIAGVNWIKLKYSKSKLFQKE